MVLTSRFELLEKKLIVFTQSALKREDFKKTEDVVGRQAVPMGIGLPTVFRQPIQTGGSCEPHCPIGSFEDCDNRVGKQPGGAREGGESSAAELADTAAQCSRPNRSVARLIHRENTLLGQSSSLSINLRRERTALCSQPCQSAGNILTEIKSDHFPSGIPHVLLNHLPALALNRSSIISRRCCARATRT